MFALFLTLQILRFRCFTKRAISDAIWKFTGFGQTAICIKICRAVVFAYLLVHLSLALPFAPREICQELRIKSGHGYSRNSGALFI